MMILERNSKPLLYDWKYISSPPGRCLVKAFFNLTFTLYNPEKMKRKDLLCSLPIPEKNRIFDMYINKSHIKKISRFLECFALFFITVAEPLYKIIPFFLIEIGFEEILREIFRLDVEKMWLLHKIVKKCVIKQRGVEKRCPEGKTIMDPKFTVASSVHILPASLKNCLICFKEKNKVKQKKKLRV